MIKKANNQKDFFGLIRLRTNVFIIEQKVPVEEEIDQLDDDAIHYVTILNEEVVATARVLKQKEHSAYIGRVCVNANYRSQHLGYQLLKYIEDDLRKQNFNQIELSAQVSVIPFYQSLGYQAFGEIYLDANINHQRMKKII